MRTSLPLLGLFVLVAGFTPPPAYAQPHDLIAYQGFLTDTDGEPLTTAAVTLTFRLYDAADAAEPIWTETHADVPVDAGLFAVFLGREVSLEAVAFDAPRWLSVALGASGAEEMMPRARLGAAPYALSLRGLRVVPVGGSHSLAGGYAGNEATAEGAAVGGGGRAGEPNRATDAFATVGGGSANHAGDATGSPTSAAYATVGGGQNNHAAAGATTIGGGTSNQARAAGAAIGGGSNNVVDGAYGTVSGGGSFFGEQGNRVALDWGTVGGGRGNAANSQLTTIGGGEYNIARGNAATIAGGQRNLTSGAYATVAGGSTNEAVAQGAVVSGGSSNKATSSHASVGGGSANRAAGHAATVAGGSSNKALGTGAVVPGGSGNEARGQTSFAAGAGARAVHDGTFVWADASGEAADSLVTTGPNQLHLRASGGAWIYSSTDRSAGVTLPAGSGAWATLSDRASKTALAPIDPETVLNALAGLPLYVWQYRTQPDSVRHLGPMAQDFHVAFGLGADPRRIATVDADGVAFAALQGLIARTQRQASEIDRLTEVLARQADLLETLEARLRVLEPQP